MHYSRQDLDAMDTRNRARFIDSLSGFKSANLIGTADQDGVENLAIVSSVFHLGANPPLMGFIIRPSSVPRHTLDNILSASQFTINSVGQSIVSSAHQTSARYDKYQSEFERSRLTPLYVGEFHAPFVRESAIKIGLDLREHQTLAVNGTEMIIGEIRKVIVDKTAVMPDGYIDVEALDVVTVSGLDSYHVTQRLARLSYAKPDLDIHPLTREGDATSWDAFEPLKLER